MFSNHSAKKTLCDFTLVSDHSLLLCVVVSGRLDCTTLTYLIVILNTSSVDGVSRRLLLSLRPGWGKEKGKTPTGEAYEIIKHPSNWLRLIAFLYFKPVVISHYHHPRWRQSSTKICLLCRLQLSLAGYLQAFTRNGPKNSRYGYLGGTGYFRIPWNLVKKWGLVHLLDMKKRQVNPRMRKHFKPLGNRGGLAVVYDNPYSPHKRSQSWISSQTQVNLRIWRQIQTLRQ